MKNDVNVIEEFSPKELFELKAKMIASMASMVKNPYGYAHLNAQEIEAAGETVSRIFEYLRRNP